MRLDDVIGLPGPSDRTGNVAGNPGQFSRRGGIIDVYPSGRDIPVRIELFGDEIENISIFDPLTGEILKRVPRITIYPKTHYVMTKPVIKRAVKTIRAELDEHEKFLVGEGKVVEAQRLHQRTMYDLEMMKEMGFCRGIETIRGI